MYCVHVCLLGIHAQPCLLTGLGDSSLTSFELLNLAAPNRFVFSRWTAANLTEMWQKTMTRDFVESPWVHNLLISDYFCQLPLFSRFTIHFAPILYLFQGRSIGNKTWEHLHINNSHVGDMAVPCVTEMRKPLLMSKWRGDHWMKFSAITHKQLR